MSLTTSNSLYFVASSLISSRAETVVGAEAHLARCGVRHKLAKEKVHLSSEEPYGLRTYESANWNNAQPVNSPRAGGILSRPLSRMYKAPFFLDFPQILSTSDKDVSHLKRRPEEYSPARKFSV